MRLALRVTVDGAATDHTAGNRAIVNFERHFDRPLSLRAGELRYEHVLWLGWQQAALDGQMPHEFEEFLDLDSDVEVLPPPKDPTTTAATAGT